jgi:hypothetical protein
MPELLYGFPAPGLGDQARQLASVAAFLPVDPLSVAAWQSYHVAAFARPAESVVFQIHQTFDVNYHRSPRGRMKRERHVPG